MRILMMTLLLATTSGALHAADPEKGDAESGARSALTDGHFELSMTQMRAIPVSTDRRFSMDSGFDQQPANPVGDGRFELKSTLHTKSALATCGGVNDLIFANGFD